MQLLNMQARKNYFSTMDDDKIIKQKPDLLDKGMIGTIVLFITVILVRSGFAYFGGI